MCITQVGTGAITWLDSWQPAIAQKASTHGLVSSFDTVVNVAGVSIVDVDSCNVDEVLVIRGVVLTVDSWSVVSDDVRSIQVSIKSEQQPSKELSHLLSQKQYS